MAKRLVLVFAVLVSIAVAGSVTKLGVFHVTLSRTIVLSGNVLRPGDYKLVVADTKITLMAPDGGGAVEAPAKIESASSKFDTTAVTYETNNSKNVISEIDLGGTKTKLMFVH